MNNITNRKKSIYLKTAIGVLITSAILIFLILLLIRPTVYLSKESGFPKNEAMSYKHGKIRFIVPESADIINHTQIPIKMNWFTTNRLGSVVSVQPKKGKALAIDFSNLKHDEVIFEITVKNLFGIKTKYDVIIDYSNYLRVFFEKNHLGETRKPIVLPYYKLDHEFRHIKEELYKLESFYRFNTEGKKEKDPVSKSLVFSKTEAKGHAFLVDTTNEIIVNYDFVLPGIFENNAQKTFILERIRRSQKTLKTLNPKDKGLKLKFNQAPFYVTEFLGWFYYDNTGNRVNIGIGEEINIPSWVKSEFKLTARYKYEISNQAADDINKLGYVAISYFDGPERVYFAIIKKGTAVENFKLNKPGYETLGWHTDEALTKVYDFTPGVNIANKNLSLYLKSRRTSTTPHEHKITFITPAYATQLVPVYTMHGETLDLNYSLPSMVTGYENGQFTELDYWTIVDPISGADTGKRFNFNTQITSDLTLKAHLKPKQLPVQESEITYLVKKENVDGSFEETKIIKKAIIGTTHTVNLQNPDETIYQNPEFSQTIITVNAQANENKVTITLKRKVYTVEFEVKGHATKIPPRTKRHGAAIGEIDETPFLAANLAIVKAELDGRVLTKHELEKTLVKKPLKVTLYIAEPVKKIGKYPQTKVENPEGIEHLKDEEHELKFNSKAKDYTLKFIRSFWKDSAGNKYEKYNGEYFKFEDVEFVRIPNKKTWFTKHIIDFTFFNFFYYKYPDNAIPERSVYSSLVKDISKFLGVETFSVTFDDGEFGIKSALDADYSNPKLIKTPTDYARAIHGGKNGHVANYRGVELSPFIELNGFHPWYDDQCLQCWWLEGQWINENPQAYHYRFILFLDGTNNHFLNSTNVSEVLGVSVCIK